MLNEWSASPVREQTTAESLPTEASVGASEDRAMPRRVPEGRLLVVDDEADIRNLLSRHLLSKGFHVDVVGSCREAIGQMRRVEYDGVLCDIRMNGMSGVELLRAIRLFDQQVAFLLVSGLNDISVAVETMKLGADDYIAKPFKIQEVHERVQAALARRLAIREQVAKERALENTVEDRERQLVRRDHAIHALFLKGVRSIVLSLEAKDKYTKNHSRKVSELSDKIAAKMGFGPSARRRIRIAGLLHDVGKIGVDRSILHKEGPLTPEEYEAIKEHPLISERILQPIMQRFPDIVKAVKHEHEKWDGSGYPGALKGTDIPIGARIIAVADCYDAITSDRPYRNLQARDIAVEVIGKNAGTQFDPQVVKAFLEVAPSLTVRPSES